MSNRIKGKKTQKLNQLVYFNYDELSHGTIAYIVKRR